MNGYAQSERIGARKTTYVGTRSNNTRVLNCNSAEKVSAGNNEKKRQVTVAGCAGTRECYKMQTSEKSAVKYNSNVPAVTSANEGFVYVEHSGFVGTFRDVFFTKREKSNGKSCFDKVVTVLLFAVLLFFVVGSFCEYLDVFNEMKEIKSEMLKCREEQTKLIMAIDRRDNFAEMEEYAINNLGMVKSENLTRHYVNISEKDIVRISEEDNTDEMPGGVLLSGFRNIISNFVGEK